MRAQARAGLPFKRAPDAGFTPAAVLLANSRRGGSWAAGCRGCNSREELSPICANLRTAPHLSSSSAPGVRKKEKVQVRKPQAGRGNRSRHAQGTEAGAALRPRRLCRLRRRRDSPPAFPGHPGGRSCGATASPRRNRAARPRGARLSGGQRLAARRRPRGAPPPRRAAPGERARAPSIGSRSRSAGQTASPASEGRRRA